VGKRRNQNVSRLARDQLKLLPPHGLNEVTLVTGKEGKRGEKDRPIRCVEKTLAKFPFGGFHLKSKAFAMDTERLPVEHDKLYQVEAKGYSESCQITRKTTIGKGPEIAGLLRGTNQRSVRACAISQAERVGADGVLLWRKFPAETQKKKKKKQKKKKKPNFWGKTKNPCGIQYLTGGYQPNDWVGFQPSREKIRISEDKKKNPSPK